MSPAVTEDSTVRVELSGAELGDADLKVGPVRYMRGLWRGYNRGDLGMMMPLIVFYSVCIYIYVYVYIKYATNDV